MTLSVKFSTYFWLYSVYSMHLLCSGQDIPNFGVLDIRVGKILGVRDHLNAHSLYVETVDFGEMVPKEIVSSLRHFLGWHDLCNKSTLFVVNLEPIVLRGVESHGMILCVSEGEKVELLIPPEGSEPGDAVHVEGYEYKPEPKISIDVYDSIEPYLKVNDDRVVTFNNIPWNVSGKGVVTTKTLKNISFESKPSTSTPYTRIARDPNSTAFVSNTRIFSRPDGVVYKK